MTNKYRISPSIMCVDFSNMYSTIKIFEKTNIEYLHIDIMDGEFVPNFSLGTDFCRKLRKMTDIPLDIHLMITRPDTKLDWFDIQKGEYVSIHYESTPHVQRTLVAIRAKGGKPMLALNPATPIEVLEYVMDDIDGVLIMTVNPGFAGQKMIPSTLKKIQNVRRFLDSHCKKDIEIEVDGNVSFEKSVLMRDAGANIFVEGSSSIFSSASPLEENIARMRKILEA